MRQCIFFVFCTMTVQKNAICLLFDNFLTIVAVALPAAVRTAVAATIFVCQLAVVMAEGSGKGYGYDKDDNDLLHNTF